MSLIFEPTVEIVWTSNPCFSGMSNYSGGWDTVAEDTDIIPEFAGRVCYQSFDNPRPGGNQKYIGHILEAGHGSVLEHSHVGFVIKGVSRSLTHELIRHKAGTAFSQLSQRYVEPDTLGFVVPPLLIGNDEAVQEFSVECNKVKASYDRMLKISTTAISREWQRENPDKTATRDDLTFIRKKAREAARAVLPNCTETHIVATANLRAWRNILEQRGSIHADLEIRRLSVALYWKLRDLSPSSFQDVRAVVDTDGRVSVVSDNRKV